MPNLLEKTVDRFNRMLLRTTARVPVKKMQMWVYTAALDVYDFKTLDYLLGQKNLNITDDDRITTIKMVASAHRWVSNGGTNRSYHCDEDAHWWTHHPLHAPDVQARFLMNLLKKSLKSPFEDTLSERSVLNCLEFRRNNHHISLDLSSNNFVFTKMKFSPQVIPFAVIKSLNSYSTDPCICICDRSTCDELLRRYFKKIDWMADLDPQNKTQPERRYAWKGIVEYVPEPYLLSLIRSHKDLVHSPYFIEKILKREFSFKLWSSVCEAGANVDVIQEKIANMRHTDNENAMDKISEFCNYFTATQQKGVLIKIVDEVAEEEFIPPPRKRKM